MNKIAPALCGFLLLLASSAMAASPFDFDNWFFNADTCTSLTPPTPFPATNTAICLDRGTGSLYVGYGSAWSLLTYSLASPTAIGSGTPASGAFTTLSASGATTLSSTLAAGATTVTGAISATTTVTAAGVTDKTLNVSNGGHISNPIGTGTPPTSGTGTVVAGGTDNAMRVTGATSPATISFGTNFAVAPVCVCSNGSTAADGCKTSSEAVGSVVVTTAGTDTFSLICIGK